MEPLDYIENLLDIKSYNTVINRYVKNNFEECVPVIGEVGSYYNNPDCDLTTIDSYYLYLILDLSDFNKLALEYKIKRKII